MLKLYELTHQNEICWLFLLLTFLIQPFQWNNWRAFAHSPVPDCGHVDQWSFHLSVRTGIRLWHPQPGLLYICSGGCPTKVVSYGHQDCIYLIQKYSQIHNFVRYYSNLFEYILNVFLWCKAEFVAWFQSSVSHDPSEIILIFSLVFLSVGGQWFGSDHWLA